MALVIMRHGPTAATPLQGKPQASGPDLPLSSEARADLARVIPTLPKVDAIYASDLQRATETAQQWSKDTGAPIKVLPALESWDLGKYRGQHSAAADAVVKELVAHPTRKPPGGGESFHDFLGRLLPVAVPLIADQAMHGMVGHSRSIKALQAYMAAGGHGIDLKTWHDDPLLKPGQAVTLTASGVQRAA